jgi:hypothetical protein
MRSAAICLSLTLTGAMAAPLSVQLRCDSDSYLVYEAIPVVVNLHNYTGRAIQIDEADQKSSLDFVVTSESGAIIRALKRPTFGQPVIIPSGQTVTETIDLLPLYELRERGTYRIQAVVRTEVGTAESLPARITLINGRELWSQLVGLPVSEGDPQQYRTFALLVGRDRRENTLYASVRDDAHSIVYSLVPLGSYLSTLQPQARVDRSGNLHVLFQNGPRSYGYVQIDPFARPTGRAAYSDFLSPPTLTVNDGEVSVTGGEQTYPKTERIMTEQELTPPPPPPPPKPKRHWWWPFGRS